MLLAVPSYYVQHRSERPLYTNYHRLRPFADFIAQPSNKILLGDYNGELREYLRLARANVETFDYRLLSPWDRTGSLAHFLADKNINLFFVQPRIVNELRSTSQVGKLLDEPEMMGWRRLAVN